MKRWLCVVMCICLLAGLTACQEENPGQTQISSAPDDSTPAEKAVLDVYYLKTDAVSEQIVQQFLSGTVTVNATGFDDIETMDLQIATEVGTDKGPDVILFPAATTLDTEKMARNGAFLDLSHMVQAEDFAEQYFASVISGGQIGEKQLLMPLRFRILSLITSQEALAGMGITMEDLDTVSKMMDTLTEKSEDFGPEEAAILVNYTAGDAAGLLYDNLRLAGLQVADLENQSLQVSEDLFREFAEYAKLQWQQVIGFQPVWRKYMGSDLTEVFTRARIQTRVYSMFQDLRYYDSFYDQALEQTMTAMPYPNYEDANAVTADVLLYAAVLNTTDQPEAACDFVRSAMDASIRNISDDLSVSRYAMQMLLDKLHLSRGKNQSIGGGKTITVEKMSDALKSYSEDVLASITSASIPNGAVRAILTETMGAYLAGEADFDDSYARFQNQIGIYLYE